MTQTRVHAFGDDALGDHDATALAELVRAGEVSATELVQAAITRADKVAELNGIQTPDFDRALRAAARPAPGPFSGVPTFIKDNTDVSGLPSSQGSEAFAAKIAKHHGPTTRQLLGLGLISLGKTTLPEFGLNAATEWMTWPPTRNPWNPAHSPGASSGGSAALVAAGVVPIAHANDGGGSIRIPAACCGLVGLKPTRGRLAPNIHERVMPVQIISEGVLTRSVRDTARAFAAMERQYRATSLPPIGAVEGPGKRRLRVGVVFDSVSDAVTDADTRAAVGDAAQLLADLGHHVQPAEITVPRVFEDDFGLYWGVLAYVLQQLGGRIYGVPLDRAKLDGLTTGLADHFRRNRRHVPAAIMRLRRSREQYARMFQSYDVIVSPVLAHTTPELGYLSPTVPFDELFARLRKYVAFTPINNAAGSPAMSLPLGASRGGLPIGVQFNGAHGDERTLLELAFEIEAARPFRRIQD
jgi:amidase